MVGQLLFSNNDLSGYLRTKEISMLAEIDSYGEEEILNLSTDELCDDCEKQYSSPTIVVRKNNRDRSTLKQIFNTLLNQGGDQSL